MRRILDLIFAACLLTQVGCEAPQIPDRRPTMQYGPPMSVGLSFDFYANETQKTVKVGEQFSIFVIAFGVEGDPYTTGFSIPALNSSAFTVVKQFVYPDRIGFDQISTSKADFLLRHGDAFVGGDAVHLMRLDVKATSAGGPINFALANSTGWQSLACPNKPLFSTYDAPTTPICLESAGLTCTLRVES